MAAGPTKEQVYRAKRKLCIMAEREAKKAGYVVMRSGAKMVNVFRQGDPKPELYGGGYYLGELVGSIWPKVLRASNGEACMLLDSDSDILRELVK